MFLRCGDHNKVLSVVEPTMCYYEMRFETPLACPIDAFLGKCEWYFLSVDPHSERVSEWSCDTNVINTKLKNCAHLATKILGSTISTIFDKSSRKLRQVQTSSQKSKNKCNNKWPERGTWFVEQDDPHYHLLFVLWQANDILKFLFCGSIFMGWIPMIF